MRDVCTWRHIIINKGRCDAWAKRDRAPRLELINAKNVFYSVAAQNEKRMGGDARGVGDEFECERRRNLIFNWLWGGRIMLSEPVPPEHELAALN